MFTIDQNFGTATFWSSSSFDLVESKFGALQRTHTKKKKKKTI